MLAMILAPLLVAVGGCLVYAFAANPKLVEIGRLAAFVGMIWTVYVLASHIVRLP